MLKGIVLTYIGVEFISLDKKAILQLGEVWLDVNEMVI